MINPEIVNYIKAEKTKGTVDDTIKTNLLNNGWKQEDINEAMAAIATNRTVVGVSTNPMSPLQLEEIKQYRRKIKWIVFTVLTIVYILYIAGTASTSISSGNAQAFIIYCIIGLLVIFSASHLATLGTSPKRNQALEIGSIILKIIGTAFLAFAIIIGLFFALCLFGYFGQGL